MDRVPLAAQVSDYHKQAATPTATAPVPVTDPAAPVPAPAPATSPPTVVVVTLYDSPIYWAAVQAAGAGGFLGKSQLGEGLQQAVTQIFPAVCVPYAGTRRRR